MESKHHLTPEGPKPCKASERACKYGEHFATQAEADRAFAKRMTEEQGLVTTLAKPKAAGNEPQERRYDMLLERVLTAEASVEKANKRLARAGIIERFELTYEPYETVVKEPDGSELLVERARVVLTRPLISYGGFKFLSRIEEEEGGFVAYNAPGADLRGWRPTSMECEHCHKPRARAKVYRVEGPDGSRKVIGGQCLKLYTGLSPAGLAALEYEEDLKEHFGDDEPSARGTRAQQAYNADEVLKMAAAVVKQAGRYESASYDGFGTGAKVKAAFFPGPSKESKEWAEALRQEAAQVDVQALRQEIREALAEEANTKNDWQMNVAATLDSSHVSPKAVGTLASALSLVERRRRRLEEEKVKEVPWASGFLGAAKEKLNPTGDAPVKASVLNIYENEDTYGYSPKTTYKVILKTEDGHRLQWSSSTGDIPQEGESVLIDKATISGGFTSNRGLDTTKINRVKWRKEERSGEAAEEE